MLKAKLNVGTRFAFGAGAVPETLKNSAWDMFVLFYFTQVLGMSGVLAGLAITLVLIFDAVIDPTIGSLSDSMPSSRFGRRQTLMALSILPFGVGFGLLFSPPSGLSDWGLFAWLITFAIICRGAISLFTIPYYALGVELSRSPIERPLLTAFRQVSTAIGRFGMPLIAFTFFFAATPEHPNGQLNRDAYIPFAWTLSAIAMVLMVWCIMGTYRRSKEVEADAPSRKKGKISLIVTVKQVIEAFRCTPNVRWQVGLGVFMFISLGILNVYTLHLTTYYWRLTPEEIRNVSIALAPGTLLAALFAHVYVPRFQKRHLMMFSILVYGVVVLVPILGPLTGIFPQPHDALQVPLLIAFKFLGGVAYGTFLVTSATVASDIADELELNAGSPRQALMSSFTFFTFGAASALVNLFAGIFLDVLAFPVGVTADQVPADKVRNLALFTGGIIAFAVTLVMFFVSRLKISVEKQEEINRALEERYRSGKQADEEAAAAAAA